MMVRPSGAFSALANRNFRLFFTGQLVSLVGTWMQQVSLSWLVLQVTDSAWYVGMVNALDSIPVLLLALYAGVVADRVSRHRMVMVTNASAMLLALTLATLVFTHTAKVWAIMVIATLFGLVNAFDIPARHTLYGDLVGKEGLMSAVALNSSSFNATRIIGPVVAGFILSIGGAGWCFLINGLSYIGVLVGLFMMDVPAPPPDRPRMSALGNMLEGLRYVWTERRTRGIVLLITTLSIFGSQFLVLLPVIARDDLGKGAQAYGWMLSAVGFGALAGALWVASASRKIPRGRLLLRTSLASGILVALLAVPHSIGPVLVILTAMGFVMISNGASANTLLQTLSPERLRGRVVSVYTLVAVGMAPLGALEGGAVAERFGARVALMLGGSVCVLGSLLVRWKTPELKTTN